MEHGLEAFFESDRIRVFDFEDSWTSTHNRLVVRPVFLQNDKTIFTYFYYFDS